MPRTATLTETDNKNTIWGSRTINAQNMGTIVSLGFSAGAQQQNIQTVKVGVVLRVKSTVDWKRATYSPVNVSHSIIIGGITYALPTYATTTSYVTKILNSGNVKTTRRFSQADVDAMYFEETAGSNGSKNTKYGYTTNRVHEIEYCYEHKIGGLDPVKFGKLGGLDIGKVWKVGGRSQMSGTADIAEV